MTPQETRIRALYDAGDRGEAAELCATLPKNAFVNHMLGVIRYDSGDAEGALSYLIAAVRRNRRNAGYHRDLGLVYQALWRLDEAEGAFRTAIARDRTGREARIGLAHLLTMSSRFDEAIKTLQDLLKIDPVNAEARRRFDCLATLKLETLPAGRGEGGGDAFRRCSFAP